MPDEAADFVPKRVLCMADALAQAMKTGDTCDIYSDLVQKPSEKTPAIPDDNTTSCHTKTNETTPTDGAGDSPHSSGEDSNNQSCDSSMNTSVSLPDLPSGLGLFWPLSSVLGENKQSSGPVDQAESTAQPDGPEGSQSHCIVRPDSSGSYKPQQDLNGLSALIPNGFKDVARSLTVIGDGSTNTKHPAAKPLR